MFHKKLHTAAIVFIIVAADIVLELEGTVAVAVTIVYW